MRSHIFWSLFCFSFLCVQAAADKSKEPSPFKKHFQQCSEKNEEGGCQKCIDLFKQGVEYRYHERMCQHPDHRQFDEIAQHIKRVSPEGFLHYALCCRAACMRPHGARVSEECLAGLDISVPDCEKAQRRELKIAAGAGDVCALYALGLSYVYGQPQKNDRAILVFHAVGEKHPESFADIARIYGNKLFKWHVRQAPSEYEQDVPIAYRARRYFECAGDRGYVPGYMYAAKVQEAALRDAIAHAGVTNKYDFSRDVFANYAGNILKLYEKAEGCKRGVAWDKIARFIHEYKAFFPDEMVQQKFEKAAIKGSAFAVWHLAQVFERQGREQDALVGYEFAGKGFQIDGCPKEAKDAWLAAARIYEKQGQLDKVAPILKTHSMVDYADFRLCHAKDFMGKPLYEQAFAFHQDLLKTFPDKADDPLLKLFCVEYVECCQDEAKEAQICRLYARRGDWQVPARQLIQLYRTNPDLLENLEVRKLLLCCNFETRGKRPFYVQGLLAEDAATASDVTFGAYRDDAVRMYMQSLRKGEATDAVTGLIRLVGCAEAKKCVDNLQFDAWSYFSDVFRVKFAKEFRARIYGTMRRYLKRHTF